MAPDDLVDSLFMLKEIVADQRRFALLRMQIRLDDRLHVGVFDFLGRHSDSGWENRLGGIDLQRQEIDVERSQCQRGSAWGTVHGLYTWRMV